MAYKKRQRANKRREMETLMRDNLLNILTVPGKEKVDQSIFKIFHSLSSFNTGLAQKVQKFSSA